MHQKEEKWQPISRVVPAKFSKCMSHLLVLEKVNDETTIKCSVDKLDLVILNTIYTIRNVKINI